MLLSFYNGDDVKISESNGETTRNLAREREICWRDWNQVSQ